MDNQAKSTLQDRPMRQSRSQGALLVVGMLAVAVLAAVFAWNFRLNQSHHVLEFYGGPSASLIRRAKVVEWLEVTDGQDVAEGSAIQLAAPIDISSQSGLIHARAAMISDVSYKWDAEGTTPQWHFVLRFRDSNAGSCSVAFDLTTHQCMCLENGNRVAIGEKLSDGLKAFSAEVQQNTTQDE